MGTKISKFHGESSSNYLYDLIIENRFKAASMFLSNPGVNKKTKLRHLLHRSNDDGMTCLHRLIQKGMDTNLTKLMIDIGGSDLVLQRNNEGDTALHIACWDGAPLGIIQSLVWKGGRSLVLMRDEEECTALQILCRTQDSLEIVKYLLSIGGREMLYMSSKHGWNPLHEACDSGNSLDTVKYLIAVGGNELILKKDCRGWNSFFWACDSGMGIQTPRYNAAQEQIVEYLVNILGDSLIGETDGDGDLPIHVFVRSSMGSDRDMNMEVLCKLLRAGRSHGLGDEHLVGGLFAKVTHDIHNEYTHTSTRTRRDNVCTIFETLVNHSEIHRETLYRGIADIVHGTPLLQAAIIANSTSKILEEIIEIFQWSIFTRNSMGQLPLEVAIDFDLKWDEGIEVFVDAYLRFGMSPILLGTAHGLKWENGMKHIVERDATKLDTIDPTTNLYPFQLAAAGYKNDLSSIYELMRNGVDLVIK
jgi:hypothetical protein